ncbi:hypothetical protein SAMN05216203_1509 [Marinobacter daqiaonensis]|uniref:Uncharacterized protein n=1 Tax=Marinobacter daqiaonensis TaxID=650891 RepID=A0A1I6HSR2_9GAMM|nr:hypothetical protein [Marinobacter daqiaonensis]SFR57502.1 hypothetical protein SAMN05216203_1509 [Marinobacter daqiaonensis]
MTWFLRLMGKPIHIVMNDEWASRHRPLTFTLPADAALYGTADSIKQSRTPEGYFLVSDVEFSPEGIRFILTDGKPLSFVPEDWKQAWQASSTPRKTLKLAEVTDDWLAFMFGYRAFDGTRGREKNRGDKDYLVNTVHGLRYLHEQEEGEELTVPGAIEQVVEALAEGKDGFHFSDDASLPWPDKWKTSGALLKAVNNDRKDAADIKGWTIKRGRPKGKKTDE